MYKSKYRYVLVDGRAIQEHRVITGAPKGTVVDHIDGDRYNNDPANLQVTTNKNNTRRRVKLNKNNTTGFRGVVRAKGKWSVRVKVDGKGVCLGSYDDKLEAAAVASAFREYFYGEEWAGVA